MRSSKDSMYGKKKRRCRIDPKAYIAIIKRWLEEEIQRR